MTGPAETRYDAITVQLTKDYATAERDFREHGYCLPGSVLLAAQLTKLRDRVAQQDRRDGTAYVYDKDSQRIISLHVKDGADPLVDWFLYVPPDQHALADGAFLSWFARQSPSTGIYGLYDMAGIFSTYSTAC